MPGIYNCSKFAVRGLSESLRYSLDAHGIGVSVLCPGLVKSYIYASADVRPDALRAQAKETDPAFVERLASIHQAGMEPDEIAAKVIDAVRANRFYVFTHPEHKDELREVFDEILADYPDGDTPADRMAIEQERRERYRAARQAARNRVGDRPDLGGNRPGTRSGRNSVHLSRQIPPRSRSGGRPQKNRTSASRPRSSRPRVSWSFGATMRCWVVTWTSRRQRCSTLDS